MRDDDDDAGPAPAVVVAAVAAGTAPVPFIAVYAVMFIVHGTVHPVVPPDITHSKNGELLAGIIAAVIFVVEVFTLVWAMGGRRRWPFAIIQLAMLGTAVDFIVDDTKGGRLISVAIVVVTAAALVLIFTPPAWPFYNTVFPGSAARSRRRTPGAAGLPAGSAPVSDATPAAARYVGGSARPPGDGPRAG